VAVDSRSYTSGICLFAWQPVAITAQAMALINVIFFIKKSYKVSIKLIQKYQKNFTNAKEFEITIIYE
jgi:hypothetical protein